MIGKPNTCVDVLADSWQWEKAKSNCKWIVLFGSTGTGIFSLFSCTGIVHIFKNYVKDI
jgi:hypothetical protein